MERELLVRDPVLGTKQTWQTFLERAHLSSFFPGILTKPDLVDKGTEETVVDIVHNDVIHLRKGYMIVKCRGQKEITEKVSLIEASEREKAFFESHIYFQ